MGMFSNLQFRNLWWSWPPHLVVKSSFQKVTRSGKMSDWLRTLWRVWELLILWWSCWSLVQLVKKGNGYPDSCRWAQNSSTIWGKSLKSMSANKVKLLDQWQPEWEDKTYISLHSINYLTLFPATYFNFLKIWSISSFVGASMILIS